MNNKNEKIMPGELLLRAREYEAEHKEDYTSPVQPRFHLTGGIGWINDPNGFSLYKGEYHLFFQYYPYATHWDIMHWGHVKTRDFVRWERLPCALAPDEEYDREGCFSGSAVELQDGRHLLMYTGVTKTDDGRELQQQCLAFGDGLDYEKYDGNPVITAELLPPGGSEKHFRDPKITACDGGFRAVVGNLEHDSDGTVLLFRSEDALSWQLVGKVASSQDRLGRMWECPDLFTLDGKDVLLVSPQEMRTDDMEFIDGNTTLCLIGELKESGELIRETEHTIDYGLDFYAPQTVLTADGRRVMIAWMQYWNSVDIKPIEDLPFCCQMTLPRELRVRGGRLITNPVREIEAYRADRVAFSGVSVSGKTELPGVRGRCVDLTVNVRPSHDGVSGSFAVNIAEGADNVTTVLYDPEASTVSVDRRRSGWPDSIQNQRVFAVHDRSGEIKLRFILDKYSMELFVNDGEQAASFLIFSPEEADGVSFESGAGAVIDVEQFTLQIR